MRAISLLDLPCASTPSTSNWRGVSEGCGAGAAREGRAGACCCSYRDVGDVDVAGHDAGDRRGEFMLVDRGRRNDPPRPGRQRRHDRIRIDDVGQQHQPPRWIPVCEAGAIRRADVAQSIPSPTRIRLDLMVLGIIDHMVKARHDGDRLRVGNIGQEKLSGRCQRRPRFGNQQHCAMFAIERCAIHSSPTRGAATRTECFDPFMNCRSQYACLRFHPVVNLSLSRLA